MKVIFIAPPAAGKGTLSLKVSQKWQIPHISMGDLLRNVNDHDIKQKLSEGQFIDDNTVFSLLESRLSQKDCSKGYILDGFPRNLNQAKMYDKIISDSDKDRCLVLVLDLDKETAKKRIVGRKICPNCGAVYNDLFLNTKPKKANVCDNCGNELIRRDDDNEITFENRYQTYLKETYPLIDFYEKKGLAFHVKCVDSVDEIFKQVEEIVGGLYDND